MFGQGIFSGPKPLHGSRIVEYRAARQLPRQLSLNELCSWQIGNKMKCAAQYVLVGLIWIACQGTHLIADEFRLSIVVVDSATDKPIPSRIYLSAADGTPYFFESSPDHGSAVVYRKQNRRNSKSTEYHTTVSAHPCHTTLPPGIYSLTVERGKSYFPLKQQIKIIDSDQALEVALRRWNDPVSRGWYSGDTHVHRTIEELSNVVLAEDLNVVFPLTNWVTMSDTPPEAGDKNLDIEIPDNLVRIDNKHVIWPRNTEYEIFNVAGRRHTLGALFVLGHSGALQQTVPPWQPVVDAARRLDPDVLFDMDKLAWPFAMVLPTIAPDAVYELANNHMWRTEFAFRNWNTPAPPFMAPPFGASEGDERQWIEFTMGMYYALLDCGFRMPPSAGTANGVHPVPAGFGRVYVHLPEGFDYQEWRRGLQTGRSFVTTGPMLYVTADREDPGQVFKIAEPVDIPIRIEVVSEFPLTFGEILVNGTPEVLLRPENHPFKSGAYRSVIETTVRPKRSGWFAVRFWEDRPGGRVRFAHSAPWYVELDGKPTLPRREEKRYLVGRMQAEIERSRGIVSPEAMAECERALDFYRSLKVHDDAELVSQNARPLDEKNRQRWLQNMIVDHRFTADEIRLATGLSIAEAENEILKLTPIETRSENTQLKIKPYPGGRHPRRGFLDGARNPSRETKVSVFPPWSDGGYAVVDVPEAIFSNLGLIYLAHQHIPTIWEKDSVELPRLEWQQIAGGLAIRRRLPNGIEFDSRVVSEDNSVVMKMTLTNRTNQPLIGLRSQVCVMLKSLSGFGAQRKRDQIIDGPLVAVKSDHTNRWVITGWTPLKRAWTNPPVPCIHSDPVFPDCLPGQTVNVQGRLWFYEGDDIQGEIGRLKGSIQ